MKQSLFSFLFLLVVLTSFAQPKPKIQTNTGTNKQADKLMEDAMKAQGMSKEQIAEMKKMMVEGQKAVKEMEAQGLVPPGGVSEPLLKIPAKKTALINQIPKLGTAEQYSAYVKQLEADCKLKISKNVLMEVDGSFSIGSGDMASQANLGPMYLLKKQANAAIYAAAKAAVAFPANKNAQNNLGVILHQAGYAHKAIPILQYLQNQQSDPAFQVSLGHCYLSLGDTAKARSFFMGALSVAPGNVNALCGTALILNAGGKKTEAAVYVKKAMKNGYSQLADELAQQNKIQFKFSEIRQDIPEYFNARMYKPTESAYDITQVRPIDAKRKQENEKYSVIAAKARQVNEENEARQESIGKQAASYAGYIGAVTGSGGPVVGKARMMFEAASRENVEFMGGRYLEEMNKTKAANNAEHAALVEKMHNLPYATIDDDCKRKTEMVNQYLKTTSYARDQAIRNTLNQQYDYDNQKMYWLSFLIHNEQYRLAHIEAIENLVGRMRRYDDLQMLYPGPEGVIYGCQGAGKDKPKKPEEDSIATPDDTDCPVQFEIPIGVAKAKLSCSSFSIEGGEGLQGSFEKNFHTGEMTIFVGVGVGFWEKGGIAQIGGGIEGTAKAGVFVTVNGEGHVIDYGDKAEVGFEAAIGPLTTEAKLTGVLGMESGGKLGTNIAGSETVIWKTDALGVITNSQNR
jgi:tetratricopeptide (TPR) repeat protein